MREQYSRGIEAQEFLFAQLTAYVLNSSLRAPKKLASICDFMPSKMDRDIAVVLPPKNENERVARLKRHFAQLWN